MKGEPLLLFGCVVPYGVATVVAAAEDGVINELIEPGAFDQETLSAAHLTATLDVNHDRVPVQGASMFFINGHYGLYAHIRIEPSAHTDALRGVRAQWRGMSIAYSLKGVSSFMDWNAVCRHVTNVPRIIGATIVTGAYNGDFSPRYPGTWLTDRAEGVARAKALERVGLARKYVCHVDDVAHLHKPWTMLPLQSRQVEANMAGHPRFAERTFLVRHGEFTSRGC